MRSTVTAWLCLILGLLAADALQAQPDSLSTLRRARRDSLNQAFRPTMHAGVQAGPSWNELYFSPTVSQSLFQGFSIQAVVRYISDPHLGIQLEAGYERRGWTEELDTAVYTRQVDYVGLSALSHLSLGRGLFQPMLLLGPYVGYPLGEKEIVVEGELPGGRSYYGQPLPKKIQYGLQGGLGLGLDFGGFVIQLDGRYVLGFSNVFRPEDQVGTFSQSRAYNGRVALLLKL